MKKMEDVKPAFYIISIFLSGLRMIGKYLGGSDDSLFVIPPGNLSGGTEINHKNFSEDSRCSI
jgi:hypothetical protein